jgi:hypothetical protein
MSNESPSTPGPSETELREMHVDELRDEAKEAGVGSSFSMETDEHGDHLGVLRFDFGGDSQRLRHASWDEWFHTFDVCTLDFLYQEERKDGNRSNFFRLENSDRENA